MRASKLVGLGLVLFAGSVASADIYLSGVVWYGAGANGTTATEPGEYDNIVGTGNFEGVINGTPRGTTHLLLDGANNFTYGGVGSNYNALSLYFATDAGAFSLPFGSAPDLVVYGGNSPLTPAAGALVQTNGQFSGTFAYGGNSTVTIGDRIISVTQFNHAGGQGTFQLSVTPVPAPAGLGALAAAGLIATRRRRR